VAEYMRNWDHGRQQSFAKTHGQTLTSGMSSSGAASSAFALESDLVLLSPCSAAHVMLCRPAQLRDTTQYIQLEPRMHAMQPIEVGFCLQQGMRGEY
jgi:hypothetical protein